MLRLDWHTITPMTIICQQIARSTGTGVTPISVYTDLSAIISALSTFINICKDKN